jgi:quinoprotein glucose dehydrogenase
MDDLIDFTPELHEKALDLVKHYKMGPMFLSAVVSKLPGPVAALTIGTLGGGTNWPGAGYDPESHTVFAPAANAGVSPLGLVEPPEGFSDIRYLAGVAGQKFRVNEGPGFGSASEAPKISESQAKLNSIMAKSSATTPETPPIGTTVDGLPLVKPPYGLLSAINLDRGEMVWQVPHGDTPDAIRNNPQLRGMNIPKTGQTGSVGILITKTLAIAGDPQVTAPPGRARGAMLRAYNKQTGEQVGEVLMPAAISGSPMTFSFDNRQYIIVAVSGGNYTGEYIAFALPPSETRQTTQGGR